MNREKALKVLLVLLGLLFTAGVYPLVTSVRDGWQSNNEDAGPMMLSLYVTLGIFLLLAARNPSANRSVIAFAAWSSFAHGAVMAVMAVHIASTREGLLIAAAALAVGDRRCSPDRAGSGKAVRRADIRRRRVGIPPFLSWDFSLAPRVTIVPRVHR